MVLGAYQAERLCTLKKRLLQTHLLPAFGSLRLDAPNMRAELEAYVTTKLGQKLKAKTIKNHLTVFGKLLSLAADRGLAPPVRVPKPKSQPPPADFLDFEESERLLAGATTWRTFLLLALRTGLRAGELQALKWTDIDLVNGLLRMSVVPVGGRWKSSRRAEGNESSR